MGPVHIKKRKEKEVRQLWKERDEIWQKKYDLPYIELDKPLRHGWYKEIVLTENLDRYKNKVLIEEVFELLTTLHWGRTKEYCDKQWDNQRSKYLIFKDFPTISKKEFNKLSEKAQRLCIPFQYRCCRKLKTRFYLRVPKNAYKIKYTRAYITHIKTHDPTLECQMDLIDNKLLKPGFYEADKRNYNHKDRWGLSETKRSRKNVRRELSRYKNASIGSIKNELWERN